MTSAIRWKTVIASKSVPFRAVGKVLSRVGRRLVAVLVAACLVVGCGGADVPQPPQGEIRLATGAAGGVYELYGRAYVGVINDMFPEVKAAGIATGGTVDNIRLVASHRAEAGFALADVAADAVAGRSPFPTPEPIVAVARLYDNYVQLVVRSDGPVRSIADLKGRRVSIGGVGSGTAVVGERILDIAGLLGDVALRRFDIGASARALATNEIDAFFWSGGLPSSAITELRRDTAVRLIDLGSIVDALIHGYGELYMETTVPASVYGLSSAVTTVSVPTYLVVRRDLSPVTAYWLTRLLFEGQSRLVEIHPEAQRLDPGSAIMTFPLDLHVGAARWYRSAHR